MTKINRLEPSVYNKISAGEVVERPASVVKELVENSIDAGATVITVSIYGGGLREINVTDNGEGMSESDLSVAFLPHATSKIATADDLFNISHLGFRGEALPSIASVSKVTVKSKVPDGLLGNKLEIIAGEIGEPTQCGMNTGTSITVSDLFFNTPARLKFMKKPKSEETEITTLITRLILSNPNVAISYYAEGEKVFDSQGSGLYDAICSVYPSDLVDNLVEINRSKGAFSLQGYVSNSLYSKGNRSYQTFILNGRIINNTTINTAIQNSFAEYMMKRAYPVAVLLMTMPSENVDVNVHPSKADVRFSDQNAVFGFIYNAIKEAIDTDNRNRLKRDFAPIDGNVRGYSSPVEEAVAAAFAKDNSDFDGISSRATAEATCAVGTDKADNSDRWNDDLGYKNDKASLAAVAEAALPFTDLAVGESGGLEDALREARAKKERENSESEMLPSSDGADVATDADYRQETIKGIPVYKIIGQVFGTYIIVETEGEVLIIDQHAAAERIIFDRLVNEYNNGAIAVQPLLLPYVFKVNAEEAEVLEGRLPYFTQLGFEVTPFGKGCYKFDAVPADLVDMDFDEFVRTVVNEGTQKGKQPDYIREKLAYTACHCALRGNNYLGDERVELVVRELFSNGLPLQCPHGRPTYAKLSKTDLEKMFKRIV